MKIFKCVSLLFNLLCVSLSWAGDMGNAPHVPWQFVVNLSGGPAWGEPGQTQTVFLSPNFPQLYVAGSGSSSIASGELLIGAQRKIGPSLIGQLGLAIATTTGFSLKGDILQDSDPEFNNFNYRYDLSHTHLAIRGKLLADHFQFVQPYVSASVGVGFNHAYHYIDTPKLPEVLPEPFFRSQTVTALTYTLDLGVQKLLNENWAIGLGYEFADWGRSQLGPASGQVGSDGLYLSHTYVNQLLLSLSFVA